MKLNLGNVFGLRNVLFAVALILLVYVAFAGKGTTAGPLFGIALTGKALDDRKKRLAELKGGIREKEDAIQAIFANTEAEHKAGKRERMVETADEAAKCAALRREQDELVKEHDDLDSMLRERGLTVPGEPPPAERSAGLSVGAAFVADPQMREFLNGAGRLSDQSPFASPHVQVPSFFRDGRRALVSLGDTSASAGALIQPAYQPGIDVGWMRPLTIRDLISVVPTSSPLVDYYRETYTNGADAVAEASGVADGSGGLPQSTINFELVQEPVKEIGSWIPVTNQTLMDLPRVQGEVDTALMQGNDEKIEDEILAGSGVAPHLKGILNQTGLGTQAFDTDIFTTTRKALTKVRVNGKATPTGYVVSPTIMESIDLEKNNQGQFYAVGAPWGGGPKTLWGVPIIESQSTGVGTYGIVGDWRRAYLWDRQLNEIFVANQHADFAIRLMTAIIAVYRGAFGVKRPAAFCRIAWS